MTLADRVVLLNDGEVQQVGTPLELYEKPANTFAAGFIGSPEMNLINGTVERTENKPVVVLEGNNRIELAASPASRLETGQNVIFGIRPEHLAPSESGLKVRYRDAELLGAETHLFTSMGNTLLTSVCPGTYRAEPGQELFLKPDPAHVHIYDAESTMRIAEQG